MHAHLRQQVNAANRPTAHARMQGLARMHGLATRHDRNPAMLALQQLAAKIRHVIGLADHCRLLRAWGWGKQHFKCGITNGWQQVLCAGAHTTIQGAHIVSIVGTTHPGKMGAVSYLVSFMPSFTVQFQMIGGISVKKGFNSLCEKAAAVVDNVPSNKLPEQRHGKQLGVVVAFLVSSYILVSVHEANLPSALHRCAQVGTKARFLVQVLSAVAVGRGGGEIGRPINRRGRWRRRRKGGKIHLKSRC